jgi:acyl carrier protein
VTRDDVVTILGEMLLAEFDLDVADDTDLIATGRLDSLDVIRLLVAIEHRFDMHIEFGDLDVDDISSVAGLADLVTRQL